MAWRACSSSPAKTCSPSSHKDKESDWCCSTASHHQGLPKIQQAWGCSPALCRTSGVTSWKALRSLLCLPTLPHQPLAPADVSPVPGCRRVSLVAMCSTGLPSAYCVCACHSSHKMPVTPHICHQQPSGSCCCQAIRQYPTARLRMGGSPWGL